VDKTARGYVVIGVICVVIAIIIGMTVGWSLAPALFAIAAGTTLGGVWGSRIRSRRARR
jgi:hypothetical protein